MAREFNILGYEIQHIFARSLYNSGDRKDFLESVELGKEAKGNKVALFSDAGHARSSLLMRCQTSERGIVDLGTMTFVEWDLRYHQQSLNPELNR